MNTRLTTTNQCWTLARKHTEVYQRRLNKAREDGDLEAAARFKAARDAADRIAQAIRFGGKKWRERKKRHG